MVHNYFLVKLPFHIQLRLSNLFICFCSFDFSCPIFEKDHFIENLYIVLFVSIWFRMPAVLFVLGLFFIIIIIFIPWNGLNHIQIYLQKF